MTGTDQVDDLLGTAAAAVRELRAARQNAVTHAQGADDALFTPADPGGLSVEHRHAIALRIAAHTGSAALAARHRVQLPADLADAVVADLPVTDPALAALLAHADLLTLRPADATPADLAALAAAGLDTTAIVAASQLIGFVHFQLRVAAGLELLAVPSPQGA